MKFQSHPQTAPNRGIFRKLSVAVAALGLSAASALAQFTWDGGDPSLLWSAGPNWVGDVAPANGFNTNLTFAGAINTGSSTAQLTNDLTTGTFTNVIFDATAGSFYNTGNTLTNRGSMTNLSGTAQFWNVPMVMAPRTNFVTGLETNYNHVFDVGSGSIWLGGTITNLNVVSAAFTKRGTGALYLTNGGFNILANSANAIAAGTNFGGAFNMDQGSMVLNGGASSVYLVQGETTFGRSGVWGNQAASITINSGMWTNNNWVAIGRGNGTGGVSSDLTLNGSAQFWPVNFSAGFNAGDATRLPLGTITQNGSSIFGSANNGNFHIGESAGAYFTWTMNDTSRLSHNGAASGTRIGVSGTGVLNIGPTAVADVRNLVIGVGAGGNGAVYNRGQIMSMQQDGLFLGDGATSSSYFRNDNSTAPGPNTNAANIVAGIGVNLGAVVDVISGTLTGTRVGWGYFNNNANNAQYNVLGGTLGAGTTGFLVADTTGRTGNKWGNLNVTGTGISTNITMNLSQPNIAGNTSIVSVATGGTLAADTITASGAAANIFLNFNNGTLLARGATASLIGVNVDRVTVYSGGLTVDTSGATVSKTIDTLVAAPVANGIGSFGVTSIALSGTGTGYEGRPIVKISGDGTGASAYAIFDPVTGLVTGVTMTSAGSGYSVAPSVQILGGGGTALTATATIGAAASGGLTKTGAGLLTLNGGYSYTGTTLVSGGTLGLNAAGTTPAGVAGDLVNGATLALALNNGASSIPASNVTLQATSLLNFDYGTVAGAPVAAIIASGTLTVPAATSTINIAGFGLGLGQIPLIDYSIGALSGAQFANLTLGSLPPGVAAYLSNNVANTSLDLVVTATGQNLYWRGVDDLTALADANWNINTTTNWRGVGSAIPSVYLEYGGVVGDPVLFDDAVELGQTNVNLTTAVRPFLVVADTTLPYSITGAGSITGLGKLIKTNTGSLFLGTSNNYAGGTIIGGGILAITNNNALGTNTAGVTLVGGTLQMNATLSSTRSLALTTASSVGVAAGATSTWSGVISGTPSFSKKDLGTFVTTRTNTITGNIFVNQGSLTVDTLGLITNASYHSIGQTVGDNGTMNLRGSGAFSTSFDFNIADINDAIGVLNIQDTATLIAANLFVSSGNNVGSTANGTLNQTGGTVTQTGTGIGTFSIGGRRDAADNGAVGTYNMSGGTLTAFAGIRVGGNGTGTVNHTNGTINARGGINIARNTGSTGTYNLVGGTLVTFNVASSTAINSVFNFNGGVLQAAFSPPTPFMFGLTAANVQNGGAIIDASTNAVTITQALLNGGTGGLTKRGTAALTLTGSNTYIGTTLVSTGALFVTTAHQVTGPTVIADNATFGVTANSASPATIGNLTLGSVSNSTLQFTLVSGTNPVAPMLQCGTLTKNGTNTIRLSGLLSPGTFPLLQYTGQAGAGIINSNALVPHGIVGTISNDNVSTIWVTISGTPGVLWQGYSTIAGRTNLWDLNATTNWLAAGSPSDYAETTPPGDSTTFNDLGSGIVLLSNTVSPASVLITNNAVNYSFTGSGRIAGTTGITKMGTGTATLALTNANTYTGSTIISNGTLAIGSAVTIPDTSSTAISSAGTLQLNGFSETVGALNGSGLIDNSGGGAVVLTVGTGNGGVNWSGTTANSGAGGVALIKNGTGDAVISGTNTLAGGTASQVNGSAMYLTNNAVLDLATAEFWVQQNAGTASLTVDGNAKLICQNNWIAVGRNNAGAIGTLTVNSGTVQKAGAGGNIIAGSVGGTGVITVNGGQILNSSMLWLGEGATANGTLNLNGGLVQATQVRPNTASPASSIANFNGGIMQASAGNADFFGPNGTAMRTTLNVLAGGLYFDTQAFAVTNQSDLVDGGGGGGLVKLGTGSLDITSGGNSYNGLTIVSNGTLNIHGTIPGAVTVKSGTTLGGNGIIGGTVTVQAGGTLGAGASIGLLTLNSNVVLGGNVIVEVDRNGGTPLSDLINLPNNSVAYAGNLVVSNVGVALIAGDTFTNFTTLGHSGSFAGITGSPLNPGLGYSFTNGVLSVVTLSSIATNPTNLTSVVSGTTLTLSWPSDHLGWFLQTQTNSRSIGLTVPTNTWYDIAGSDTVTNTVITLDKVSPTVFFRLHHYMP